jgi:Family of unknown function (DUF6188)
MDIYTRKFKSSAPIEQICFGYQVVLKIMPAVSTVIEVIFSTPFDLGIGDERLSVDPGSLTHESAAAVVSLLRKGIDDATIADDGELVLNLEGRVRISSRPSEAFEAWEFTDPSWGKAVCLPGGEIGVFEGRPHRT